MPEENISDDFKNLGQNLTDVLRAAWNRSERKTLQKDVESGLKEIGQAVNRVVEDISASEMGKKIKTEVGDIKGRVESGEMESKIRSDIQDALRNINVELENLIVRIQGDEPGGEEQ